MDDASRPIPKKLKKGMLFLFVVIAAVAAIIAFMLPKKQVEASQSPISPTSAAPQVQRAQADAFKSPATK
jgi:hypothetical protein